ncbi:hypothetical protein [Streptomyces sp. VRA16 Mangrove soil]|uniref:hypothetical protein n=1 Tax=Streptomyces sp. VRA16 Mangrove soil TaxID=2817434 RepID=UPI001A9E23D6|nr:hypothetical protein [Streptomyces sp. VRA16 Mangrove soil]MBO1338041.1 hypothetical protein [Streptomyces sp. VRA16 Mangrove soil]
MSLDGRQGDDDLYGGTGQTRTRLPEGSDGYGGGRRPGRSSSRSLVTVVGVVVLLIAAIAFANRGGDDDSASGGKGASGSDPAASPTAPTGTKPVSSGFAHDEQGAQSAAANFAVQLVSADMLKPADRAGILNRLFVPDKVAALQSRFDKAYSKDFLAKIGLDANGNAASGQTYVSRTVPVGTKTSGYSDSTTTAEVWCTGAFGTAGQSSTNPVTNDWFTLTLKLRWVDGDWKVESFSQKDGPTPVNGDNKVSSTDEISKAVEEYGGFTYAR